MGRKSSIPEEILQYRPCKCTRLRDEGNGVYRVYKYTATKLAEYSGVRWAPSPDKLSHHSVLD